MSLTTGLFLFSEEVCGTEEFKLSCLLEELRDDEDEIAIDKSSADEAEAGEVFAFLLSFFSTPSSLFGMQVFNSVDFLCLLLLFSSEEALDFLAYKQTTNKYKILFLKEQDSWKGDFQKHHNSSSLNKGNRDRDSILDF